MISHSLSSVDVLSAQVDSLQRPGGAGGERDPQRVAEDFESLLVSLLVKEMRQSVGGEGLFAGDQSDTYGALFDLYLGQSLAQNADFGIAELVARSIPAEEAA